MSGAATTRTAILQALDELQPRALLARENWSLVCDDPFRNLFGGWDIDPGRLFSVDRLDRGSGLGPHPDLFAVVCTEAPEAPVQRVLKESGVHSFGLFSQLIPRLAARRSPRGAARPTRSRRLEYAILCLGRCGSTLACRELRMAGAGYPVEHFRRPVQILLRERDVARFDFARWWDLVRNGVDARGVFATKILYTFWEQTQGLLAQEEQESILDFLRGVPVIHIERADKYAQAVSDYMANQTGVWHLWETVSREAYEARTRDVEPDDDYLLSVYGKFCADELALKAMMARLRIDPIRVSYDDLTADPKETISGVMGRLGLEAPPDYLGRPPALRPTSSDTHRVLRDRLERLVERRGSIA